MKNIFEVLLPVFGIILTGFLVGRYKALGRDLIGISDAINNYVYYICMPAFLFLSMSKVSEPLRFNYIFAYAFAMFCTALITWAITYYAFRRRNGELILAVMSVVYCNSVYIGVPVMKLAYQDITAAVNITVYQVIIITPIILFLLDKYEKKIKQ